MRSAGLGLLLGLAGWMQSSQPVAPLSVYTDKQFGFSFTYPTEYVATPSLGTAASDSTVACETMPLTAVRKMSERQIELIAMARIDFTCLKQPASVELLKPIATQALQRGLEKIGPPAMLPAVSYKLDGHDAVFVQGSAPDPSHGIPGHAGVVCVLASDAGIVCWSVLTAYPSHFKGIFSNGIQFTGGSSQPLVPEEKIQTPPGKDPS